MDHYSVTLDVRRGIVHGMGMDWLVNVVSEALEKAGAWEHDYYVVQVKGPPELHIGVTHR